MREDSSNTEEFIPMLESPDYDTRRYGAEWLATYGDNRALEALVKVANNRQEVIGIRQDAIQALGRIGDKRAFDTLLAIFQDEQNKLSLIAARALGQLKDERAFDLLLPKLSDTDLEMRRSAASGLGLLGDKRAVEPLLELLEDSDIDVQSAAIYALGDLADRRAVQPLLEILQGKNAEFYGRYNWIMQETVAKNLGYIGDPIAIKPLLTALKNSSHKEVHKEIARALGFIGGEEAKEALLFLKETEPEPIQFQIAKALKRIEDSQAKNESEKK